jgi:hypothetical protein
MPVLSIGYTIASYPMLSVQELSSSLAQQSERYNRVDTNHIRRGYSVSVSYMDAY